jgi:hypothetical protein
LQTSVTGRTLALIVAERFIDTVLDFERFSDVASTG